MNEPNATNGAEAKQPEIRIRWDAKTQSWNFSLDFANQPVQLPPLVGVLTMIASMVTDSMKAQMQQNLAHQMAAKIQPARPGMRF